MDNTIRLVTKEHKTLPVDKRFSDFSGLIASVLEDTNPNEEIPIEFIAESQLVLILEYLEHHEFLPLPPLEKPITSGSFAEIIGDQWDTEFINKLAEDEGAFYEFIMATYYLDIKCLLDLCLCYLAVIFKGSSIEELRVKYSINEELNEEVNEELKEEFAWAVEQAEDRVARSADSA